MVLSTNQGEKGKVNNLRITIRDVLEVVFTLELNKLRNI